jgi:hypothetical protein
MAQSKSGSALMAGIEHGIWGDFFSRWALAGIFTAGASGRVRSSRKHRPDRFFDDKKAGP